MRVAFGGGFEELRKASKGFERLVRLGHWRLPHLSRACEYAAAVRVLDEITAPAAEKLVGSSAVFSKSKRAADSMCVEIPLLSFFVTSKRARCSVLSSQAKGHRDRGPTHLTESADGQSKGSAAAPAALAARGAAVDFRVMRQESAGQRQLPKSGGNKPRLMEVRSGTSRAF